MAMALLNTLTDAAERGEPRYFDKNSLCPSCVNWYGSHMIDACVLLSEWSMEIKEQFVGDEAHVVAETLNFEPLNNGLDQYIVRG